MVGLGALALLAPAGHAASINAPMGDGVDVPRLTIRDSGNRMNLVTYVLEIRSGTVKYEDATPEGLGEDRADQIDTFHFSVDNPSSQVTVLTKAAQDEATSVLDAREGASITDGNGFRIKVVERTGDRFVMTVRSVGAQKALSHVTFGFDSSLSQAGEFSNIPLSEDSTASYEDIVYGVDQETGDLVRHDFSDDSTETIGTVTDESNNPMTGIDAGVYLPGAQNTFTFWQDPDDGKTKIIYIDLETAETGQVGQPLDEGKVTGATVVHDDSTTPPTPHVFIVEESDSSSESPARLVEVDPKTGETTPVMDLNRSYDSLAANDDNTFYASDDDKVYQINPSTGEEVNVGIFENHDIDGLEVVDDILSGFENTTDRLIPLKHEVRVTVGDQDSGMTNVGMVIESDPATDPQVTPNAYD
jgi:hypothetical protein